MPIRGKTMGILPGAPGTMEPRCPMETVAQPDPVASRPTAVPSSPPAEAPGGSGNPLIFP